MDMPAVLLLQRIAQSSSRIQHADSTQHADSRDESNYDEGSRFDGRRPDTAAKGKDVGVERPEE